LPRTGRDKWLGLDAWQFVEGISAQRRTELKSDGGR